LVVVIEGARILKGQGLNLNSEIETTDSADFADFEEVLFLAKLQGIDDRNVLYPCNLRLNLFRFLG